MVDRVGDVIVGVRKGGFLRVSSFLSCTAGSEGCDYFLINRNISETELFVHDSVILFQTYIQ